MIFALTGFLFYLQFDSRFEHLYKDKYQLYKNLDHTKVHGMEKKELDQILHIQ